MKKIALFLITLVLLTNCSTNKSVTFKENLFCSSNTGNPYVLQLDNDNFEIEHISYSIGKIHNYCKGKWSYTSKKRIIFECDTIAEWDWELHPYPALVWSVSSNKEYIKVISQNKIILVRDKSKIVLKSDWCNCIPQEYLIVGGERYGMP
jgi:hypothetical protein